MKKSTISQALVILCAKLTTMGTLKKKLEGNAKGHSINNPWHNSSKQINVHILRFLYFSSGNILFQLILSLLLSQLLLLFSLSL